VPRAILQKEPDMNSEDLDITLACLMEAADSLVGSEEDPLPAELQSGFVALHSRIKSLVTFAEAYQRRVEQHDAAIRRVKAVAPGIVEEEDDDLLELSVAADVALVSQAASLQ
jgi:hypothetical protein